MNSKMKTLNKFQIKCGMLRLLPLGVEIVIYFPVGDGHHDDEDAEEDHGDEELVDNPHRHHRRLGRHLTILLSLSFVYQARRWFVRCDADCNCVRRSWRFSLPCLREMMQPASWSLLTRAAPASWPAMQLVLYIVSIRHCPISFMLISSEPCARLVRQAESYGRSATLS